MRDPLAARAAATPEETALVDAATDEEWTVGELDAGVERTAGRLAALGVGAGDHLALVLPPRPASVLVVHAALRLGCVLVPLSHDLTAVELGPRLDGAGVGAVVCGESTAATVATATDRPAVSVDDADGAGVRALPAVDPVDPPCHDWSADETVLLAHTSGTTGAPKRVVLTARNLLASALASAARLGLAPDDRWLVTLPLHHVGGLSPVLRMPLYGSTVVLRRRFDPGLCVDDVAEFDVTRVSLVPTMLRRMLDRRGTLPGCLRTVLLGGAAAPVDLIERCRNYSVPVAPTYGLTEAASQVATATTDEADADPETVGRPVLFADVTVVGEDGDPVPRGETGELVVSGAVVSPRYHDDPEATAASRGPHGFHTGDAGFRAASGRLYVHSRLDDQISTGGELVDPGEVADAVRTHPDVTDAAVVGLPDDEWGERVAALVVGGVDAEALDDHLRDRLAGFKLPRVVGLADDLPRTDSGTVDRAALRERLTAVRDDPGPGERGDRE
jgi:O-succinylbenzoic acid--CoA ligase